MHVVCVTWCVCVLIGQELSYLIVIDFESTCWQNKKGFQEISKFVTGMIFFVCLFDISLGLHNSAW